MECWDRGFGGVWALGAGTWGSRGAGGRAGQWGGGWGNCLEGSEGVGGSGTAFEEMRGSDVGLSTEGGTSPLKDFAEFPALGQLRGGPGNTPRVLRHQ